MPEVETAGIEWLIATRYVGQAEAEQAYADMQKAYDANKQQQMAEQQSMRTTKMLAMSVMSLGMSYASMAGATREQTQALQAFALVLQTVITLMLIAEAISMFSGAGAIKGVGGLAARAAIGMFHQGGYGTDRLAVIRSDERVIPSHQVFQSSSSVNIQSVHVHSSGDGRSFARQFTEELESMKVSGTRPPNWR